MQFDTLDTTMRVFETAHDHCVLPGLLEGGVQHVSGGRGAGSAGPMIWKESEMWDERTSQRCNLWRAQARAGTWIEHAPSVR